MTEITLQKSGIYAGNLILVNRTHAYQSGGESECVPVLQSGEHAPACQSSGEPQGKHAPAVMMRRRAAAALADLMREIHGWQQIVPVSGWRSRQEQQHIWDDSLAEHGQKFTETYVAAPGCSEHQTGLAIDLGRKQEEIDFICPDFPYAGICQTFREKAAGYGFIERYPKGKEDVTGIGHEPWHFRYVGAPHAAVMAEHGWTLEEYITFLRRFPYGQASYRACDGGREVEISFLEAFADEMRLELEEQMICAVSGNNIDGFIVSQYRQCF